MNLSPESNCAVLNENGVPRATDYCKRTPVYGGARDRAQVTALLSAPVGLSRGARERLHRSRDLIVEFEKADAKPHGAKLLRQLAKLPLARVGRRIRQFARRASTAKHLAAKCAGTSSFRAALRRSQDHELNNLRQAVAEVDARELAVQNRLIES